MDVLETMESLGVDAGGLADLVINGGLPAFRLRGEIKFLAADVEKWVRGTAAAEQVSGSFEDDLLSLFEESGRTAMSRSENPPDADRANELLADHDLPEEAVSQPEEALSENETGRTVTPEPAFTPDTAPAPAPENENAEPLEQEKETHAEQQPDTGFDFDGIDIDAAIEECEVVEEGPLYTVVESPGDEGSFGLFGEFSIKYLLFETHIRLLPGIEPTDAVFEHVQTVLDDMRIEVANFEEVRNIMVEAPGRWIRLGEVPNPFRDRVNIKISRDGMRAYMVTCSTDESGRIRIREVEDELDKQGIRPPDGMKTARSMVENKMFGHLAVVAEGIKPEPGRNASIEYVFDTGKSLTPKLLESGDMDYKNLDAITNVRAADLLVIKKPATDGVNGTDVRGHPVEASRGRDIRIKTGKGTVLSEDGTELRAEHDGHVFIRHDAVNVENIYYIDGDVDYSTGNIDFSGIVIVKGFVRDAFEVRADGNIQINGGVESATIESRAGDINIRLGVQGQGKARIIAAGDVTAKFIQQATVEAGSDVVTEQVIRYSDITSGGSVITSGPRGSIIGGKVRAQNIIETRNLGSESHARTEITLEKLDAESGEPLRKLLTRQKNRIDSELSKCSAGIDRMVRKIDRRRPDMELLETIKAQKKKLTGLKNISERVNNDLRRFTAQFGPAGSRFVRVKGTAFPQVLINIEGNKLLLKNNYRNPSFCCDIEENNEIIVK